MTQASVQFRFEQILSRVRQPARLIGEEYGAGSGFTGTLGELQVVLGFPDTYEIGISNQAIQVLYHLARETAGVAVERTYLPWIDVAEEMRREDVPLLTVESWSPVHEADLLGVTLQHEFNYSNLLELLAQARIPLPAAERGETDPLVLAGGPAVANFLPLSRFLDAVAVGDGEVIFPEVLRTVSEGKSAGDSRLELKHRLALVDGVYVPGLSASVTRRILPRLAGAPFPETCLVPLTTGVHDRAWIEIMRGCTRGCRFCQAGMWYRPVRERPFLEIMAMAGAQLASSGHQELALASLSTTDHTCLAGLLTEMARAHPEVKVSLPSLRVDTAAVKLAQLASPTGPSLTLAPEAGSQRMWDVVNKNVTQDDVLAAAEEAFRSGRTTLKLYFMIGLPLETDEDVIAIADLCLRVREVGRRVLGPRAGRLQLNISVNNFVPKPFTPFQWSGMADRDTLARRRELLRSLLRRRGVKLTLHDIDKSFLEAALARGGEEMGGVIEEAWRGGARFDSWTEQFRGAAWDEAMKLIGTSAEALATSTISPHSPLPWDVIGGVADRAFLWEEWQRALERVPTVDCRWGGCMACGACSVPPANDLAECSISSLEAPIATPDVTGDSAVSLSSVSGGKVRGQRYVLTFSVTGRGRFVGHLDRVEMFRRAVRRAGGRLALSEGMRPKPLLSLALPLAVGWEGLRELCEFELLEEPSPSFFERLASVVPAHVRLLSLDSHMVPRALPARVTGAVFRVELRVHPDGDASRAAVGALLREAAERFEEAAVLPVEERRNGEVREIDVKHYVARLSVHEDTRGSYVLTFRAAVTPSGTARPERVVEAMSTLSGSEFEIMRITRMQIELA